MPTLSAPLGFFLSRHQFVVIVNGDVNFFHLVTVIHHDADVRYTACERNTSKNDHELVWLRVQLKIDGTEHGGRLQGSDTIASMRRGLCLRWRWWDTRVGRRFCCAPSPAGEMSNFDQPLT